ncbi:hypothetical protein GCM10010191_84450 [Actinomadura vinacea]|uniref:Uncharacterized protein n=1 Tax=Actinomadura vinacea TaxID=115336 RepID=A0ABN3K944_9ACTN
MSRPGRPHKRWPITVITLVLLWIALVLLLIHNGPRLPRWPASAAPAPGQVAETAPAASRPMMIPPSASR